MQNLLIIIILLKVIKSVIQEQDNCTSITILRLLNFALEFTVRAGACRAHASYASTLVAIVGRSN